MRPIRSALALPITLSLLIAPACRDTAEDPQQSETSEGGSSGSSDDGLDPP